MSTTIEYKDDFGNLISGKQAAQLENHNELLLENNVPIVKKSFFKKKLGYVTFYNPQNLSNSDAINLISQEYPVTPFDIVSETQYGMYKIRTSLAYGYSSNYEGKRIELIDSNNHTVCVENYDEFGLLEELIKYALDNLGNEIIFHYSEIDRSLESASGGAGDSFNEFIGISLFNVLYPNFLNTHPYYQDGTFLP